MLDIDLLRKDECQPLTTEQVADIKSQFHPSNTANVNMISYHIYDEDGEEIRVGEVRKTIDGVKKSKPVYERTIRGTSPSASSWMNTNLSNVEKIFDINGVVAESNTQYTSIPSGHPTSNDYQAYLAFNTETNKIYFGSGSKYLNKNYTITLLYSKSSDEWQPV